MWNPKPREERQPVGGHGHGFSLIELLIVVAIILIIAAIALPNLMRSRMAANESNAVQSLRTVATASVVYSSSYANGYPPNMAALGGLGGTPVNCNTSHLVDETVTTPPNQKSGYTFAYAGVGAPVPLAPTCAAPGFNSYFATATPIVPGQTGQRSFCTDESGVIRFDPSGGPIGSPAACQALTALQ